MSRWRARCHIERGKHSTIESGVNIGVVDLKNAIKARIKAGENVQPLRPFLPHLLNYAIESSNFSFPDMPVSKVVITDNAKGASDE
jgi:hypothetical protein